MQKEEGFGGMCAWGYQASWSLIEGVGGERYVAGDLGLDPGDSCVDSGVVAEAGPLSQPEPYRFGMSSSRCGSGAVTGEVVVSVGRFAKAVKMPG